jgi:ribonucleoside-diphosphate reductase alpha chain
MDAFAISVSHGLQYGVPLKSYIKSFLNTSFAPSGITDDAAIRTTSSIVDFIARKLALNYLSFDDRLELGLASIDDMPDDQISLLNESSSAKAPRALESIDEKIYEDKEVVSENSLKDDSAPICYNCGNQTQRAGSCYVCSSCGSTTGCS